MLRLTFLLLLLHCALFSYASAETVNPVGGEVPKEVKQATSAEILEGLMQQIEEIKVRLQGNLQEAEKLELEETLIRLRKEFDELLAGKESVAYFQAEPKAETIQEELLEIFDPLIGEIKNATADSRKKEELRNQIELLKLKKGGIDSAIEKIKLVKETPESISSGLASVIAKEEEIWLGRQEQTSLELESAKLQLVETQAGGTNAVESASKVVGRFFETRGFHLLLALSFALAAFLLITFTYRTFTKYSPTHSREQLYSTSKTMDGAIHLGSILAAVIVFILTLFLYDDWVLLTTCLLLFAGGAWAAKDKVADIAEQLRLILNIGSVREGERITFQGLSWKVEQIRLYSKLINPELQGGKLRIPIGSLVGLYSRNGKDSERYFPTSKNDWVLLSDATFGKVINQSPEYVQLILLGGAHKTYNTEAFLDNSPVNLSVAGFRLNTVFGVDYKHQSTVTAEIPEKLQEVILKGLRASLENEKMLRKVTVEFASAAASSLDIEILADFSSEAAPKYNVLKRLIQRLAVEACNEYGWEIPFTQITVHQAQE